MKSSLVTMNSRYRLQFYVVVEGQKDRLFTFGMNTKEKVGYMLNRFKSNGYIFKAIFIHERKVYQNEIVIDTLKFNHFSKTFDSFSVTVLTHEGEVLNRQFFNN